MRLKKTKQKKLHKESFIEHILYFRYMMWGAPSAAKTSGSELMECKN
jgi:hypothetical protein